MKKVNNGIEIAVLIKGVLYLLYLEISWNEKAVHNVFDLKITYPFLNISLR